MKQEISLWEVLVPTERPDAPGKFFTTRYHKIFDERVRQIAGGLTILRPAIGYWTSETEDGKVYRERMIPVRIACTREQIESISDIVASYYEQLAVFCYKVSDEVIIKNYPAKPIKRERSNP